ncbi:MAG TPA: hypothetical protein VMW52_02105, partial [Phycisphaerae bacterium]|nr:hypothetical protein [Phycisphaerae bacterium]
SNAGAWALNSDDADSIDTPRAYTFDPPDRRSGTYAAAHWTALDAIASLIEWVDDYETIAPDWIRAATPRLASAPLGEVDVEGKTLLEAISAVLSSVGLGFCLDPWADRSGRHVLSIFDLQGRDNFRRKSLTMARITGTRPAADDEDGQAAQVQRLDFLRDAHNVRNRIVVVGGQKRVQLTLAYLPALPAFNDLQPAWDTTTYDLDDLDESGTLNPKAWAEGLQSTWSTHFQYGISEDHVHTYRSWAWNEDGAFTALGLTRPNMVTFGLSYDGTSYSRMPRPFGPTLYRDHPTSRSQNVPAFVEMGIATNATVDSYSWIRMTPQ